MRFKEKKVKDTPIGRGLTKIYFFYWDSPHARLKSHYEAWSYKKKKHKKDHRIQKICLGRTYS